MEQDNISSCSSLSQLWSSSKYDIRTIGDERAGARDIDKVQVPDEPKDELYTFVMEHREWICSLIQADWPSWDDRLFSALRHVLEYSRPSVDNEGVPESDPQHPQDIVDQNPKA